MPALRGNRTMKKRRCSLLSEPNAEVCPRGQVFVAWPLVPMTWHDGESWTHHSTTHASEQTEIAFWPRNPFGPDVDS